MQNGSIIRRNRKRHSDIWQFRWWEKTSEGKRIYRRREIGTVDQIPDLEAARKAACLLVPELNARMVRSEPTSMTVAQLCSHFDQRELCLGNTWRSYSTKQIYKVYLRRWIVPRWGEHLLATSGRLRSSRVASEPIHRQEYVRKDAQCHVGIVQSCPQVRVLRQKSEELDERPHALFPTAARKSLGSCQLGDTMEARPKQFR